MAVRFCPQCGSGDLRPRQRGKCAQCGKRFQRPATQAAWAPCPDCGNPRHTTGRIARCAACRNDIPVEGVQSATAAVSVARVVEWSSPTEGGQTGWPVTGRTSPGQELGLPPSGPNSLADPGQRLAARLLDGLIAIAAALTTFLPFWVLDRLVTSYWDASGAFASVGMLVSLAVWISYVPFMHATRGQTFGKRLLGTRLASLASGEKPGWGTVLLREFLGLIPYFSAVVYAWLLWDRNRQGLHDKAADTVVVRTR